MVQADRPVLEQIECVNSAVVALREVAAQMIAVDVDTKLDRMLSHMAKTEDGAALRELVRKSFRLPPSNI